MADVKKGLGIPQTKGFFQVKGNVTGTSKDKFFDAIKTKTKKDMYLVNFGVETSKENTVYISLNGMEKDKVYFYKRAEKKGDKGTTKEVLWKNRNDFNEEGYQLIGVNVGLTKKVTEKGKEVNDSKSYSEFDACEVIGNNLKDGQSTFIKGHFEFSSFTKGEETKRSVKLVPGQVSLCQDVDFTAEDFVEQADFQQQIIFMEATNDLEHKRGLISAKIVTNDNVEDAEFIIRDQALFAMFKKNLKPYTSIVVLGNLHTYVIADKVEEKNVWGATNSFTKVNTPIIRELLIIGADPDTIDTTTYSEKIIDEALRAKSEFGEKKKEEVISDNATESWGAKPKTTTEEEW